MVISDNDTEFNIKTFRIYGPIDRSAGHKFMTRTLHLPVLHLTHFMHLWRIKDANIVFANTVVLPEEIKLLDFAAANNLG